MTDQPEGMFTDAQLLDSHDPAHGDVMSVVTCTLCGSVVADTEAHQQLHIDLVDLHCDVQGLLPD
jgi:hypothetical protein